MIIYQYINVHIYVWGGTIIKVLYEQCVDAHICMCQTYNILYQHCIDAHICVVARRKQGLVAKWDIEISAF